MKSPSGCSAVSFLNAPTCRLRCFDFALVRMLQGFLSAGRPSWASCEFFKMTLTKHCRQLSFFEFCFYRLHSDPFYFFQFAPASDDFLLEHKKSGVAVVQGLLKAELIVERVLYLILLTHECPERFARSDSTYHDPYCHCFC